MSLIERLVGAQKARAQVQALLAQPSLMHAGARDMLHDLRGNSAAAFRALTDAAARTRRDQLEPVVVALRALYAPALTPLYLRALSDPRTAVAMTVAQALAGHAIDDPAALLALLDDPTVVKPAVYTALAGQRDRLRLADLLSAAAKQNGADRGMLFGMMARVAGPDGVADLVARLDARDADYRLGVVRLLGRIRTPEAAAALVRALADPDSAVRLAALDAFADEPAKIDPQVLMPCLADEHLRVQNRAVELLAAGGRAELPQMLAALLGHEVARVRRAAIEVLSQIATVDNLRALLAGARDQDWWVRSRCADALGKIGGPRVLQAALALLQDDDAFIRRTAVEILNATGGADSFDGLAAALKDQDWWVQERAIDGLVAAGDRRAVPLLRAMLSVNAGEHAQIALISALSRLQAAEAIGDLSRLLPGASRNVRLAVAEALNRLQDVDHSEATMSVISALAEDPDEDVRRQATTALQRRQPGGVATMTPTLQAPAAPRPAAESARTAPVTRAAARPAVSSGPAPGQNLGGRYQVLRQLGRGAFGTVLLVEDAIVGEQLAMKFLHAHLAQEQALSLRFVKELKLARRITHPGVIRIHDLVRVDDTLAISMEYLPSEPLSQLLRQGPLDVRRACDTAAQVARAMAAAHAVNVVHRDLKPANVLIGDGGIAKVVDFGIAAAVSEESTRLTNTGVAIGTPRYMSPEQIKGARADERSDIYSLGTVIYEMLTGRTPVNAGNNMAVMYQHLHGTKEPPSTHVPDLPAALDELVMACLATERAERPASMAVVAAALDALVEAS